MVKTYGSVDKKQRKARSDIGKKRKKYRGKPVKGRTNKPLKSKIIGNKTHIKIKVYQIKPMTKSGRLRWNKKSRRFASNETWTPLPRTHHVRTSDINSEKKLCQWVADNYYPGEFAPKTVVPCKKSKSGFCWKRLCRISVGENDRGYYGIMGIKYRIHRYRWFIKDE